MSRVLDFVNTVSDWVSESPREDLPAFAAAMDFARESGFLTKAESQGMLRLPRQDAELARLHELRELIHRVFAAFADGGAPSASDLEVLNRQAVAASRSSRLDTLTRPSTTLSRTREMGLAGDADREPSPAARERVANGRVRVSRTYEPSRSGVALLRHRLLDEALVLLLSSSIASIKACPSCRWLFLDTSKNRSRRWCSMQTCGATAKARSYYLRKKRATERGR